MRPFLTVHSLAEIRSGLSPPVERMGWVSGGALGCWWGSWYWDTVYRCGQGHTQPEHNGTLPPTRRWRGMAILRATMATSPQRGKGFGRAQWVLLERWCCRCRGLHWVCAASVPSSGFSCHRYGGALFADSHRAECGNTHHLSHRTLTSSALSSQGRRLSRQGQTITRRYSLSL